MKTIAMIVAILFAHSLIAWAVSRLFNRFDSSSGYSKSPKEGDVFSNREIHQAYIFLGSLLWPVSLTIWMLIFLPRHIVFRVERYLDKPKETSPQTPYRG